MHNRAWSDADQRRLVDESAATSTGSSVQFVANVQNSNHRFRGAYREAPNGRQATGRGNFQNNVPRNSPRPAENQFSTPGRRARNDDDAYERPQSAKRPRVEAEDNMDLDGSGNSEGTVARSQYAVPSQETRSSEGSRNFQEDRVENGRLDNPGRGRGNFQGGQGSHRNQGGSRGNNNRRGNLYSRGGRGQRGWGGMRGGRGNGNGTRNERGGYSAWGGRGRW